MTQFPVQDIKRVKCCHPVMKACDIFKFGLLCCNFFLSPLCHCHWSRLSWWSSTISALEKILGFIHFFVSGHQCNIFNYQIKLRVNGSKLIDPFLFYGRFAQYTVFVFMLLTAFHVVLLDTLNCY